MLHTLYIYDADTRHILHIIKADKPSLALKEFDEQHWDCEQVGCTFTPAFCSNDALLWNYADDIAETIVNKNKE